MIYPDWTGETVAVVAGGSSSAEIAPRLRGRCRIIAVNLAFRLVPDADVLYAADSGFWCVYKDARRFEGLKLSCDDRAHLYDPSVLRVYTRESRRHPHNDRMRFDEVGHVGIVGGNSGGQAVNLAVQFGASTVLLCGLDYTGSHWHQDHPPSLRNPSPRQMQKWAAALDREAGVLRERQVRVINLSDKSILRAYPHGDPDSLLPDQEPAALSAGGVSRGAV